MNPTYRGRQAECRGNDFLKEELLRGFSAANHPRHEANMAADHLPYAGLALPDIHVIANEEVVARRRIACRVVLDGEGFVAGCDCDVSSHRSARDAPLEGLESDLPCAEKTQCLVLSKHQIGSAADNQVCGPQTLQGLNVVFERRLSFILLRLSDLGFRYPDRIIPLIHDELTPRARKTSPR